MLVVLVVVVVVMLVVMVVLVVVLAVLVLVVVVAVMVVMVMVMVVVSLCVSFGCILLLFVSYLEEMVRESCEELLCKVWFQSANKDAIVLLRLLDVETSTETCETALRVLIKRGTNMLRMSV